MQELPEFDPWPEGARWPGYLKPVPDTGAVSPGPAGDTGADPDTDSRAVTDTPEAAVTGPSPSPVTDAVTDADSDADSDADTGLPEFEEFGREIGRMLAAWLAARHAAAVTGMVAWNAVKDLDGLAKQPDSVRDHIEWIHDMEWVPGGHETTGPVLILRALRFIWGYTLGLAFSALGNVLVWLRIPQHAIAVSLAGLLLDLFVIR